MRQQEPVRPARPVRARAGVFAALAIIPAVLFTGAEARAQISLSTAVELAEKSSPAVRSAKATAQRAAAAVQESRDAYIPNFLVGSGPGYAYGYPLGYPSLINAQSQSLLVSFSQPDYIRSARAGLKSATLSLEDTQQQVALDVALDYVELDYDLREIGALDEEHSYAASMVSIEQDRVAAGVDSHMQELQAELTAAQVEAKRVHLQNDAEEMRQKLSDLTGLPGTGLTTESTSIPPPADLSAAGGDDQAALEKNPGVAAAYANAQSKVYQAFGDKRQNYRPVVSFGAQYSLFQKFAGYTEYFRGFQYNNVSLGVQVNFPLFDASHRAKARESMADAVHYEADADAAKNVLSEQTLAMRRSLLELASQQQIARIQNEMAQEQLKTVETELANGTGAPSGPGAQPVTPRDAQQVHIQERERFEDLLDTNFSLMKVQLNLLRATGKLQDWIHSSLK